MTTSQDNPKLVLLFSGKRKSGKDYLTERLHAMLEDKHKGQSVILRLSGPLKKCYAEENGLDYQELMTAGAYKEKHRLDMIKWSEEIRSGKGQRGGIDGGGHRLRTISETISLLQMHEI